MTVFFDYSFLFLFGAVGGWVAELLFRRFFSAKKWINPGFMYGPYLPIYGFGVCVMYALSGIDFSFVQNAFLQTAARGLAIALILTALELIGGLFFVKVMKLRLWDYSRRPLNLMGIICPLFSFIWGALGVVFYLFCYPTFRSALELFNSHTEFLFAIGLIYGIMLVDLGTSLHLATKLRKAVEGSNLIIHFESLKLAVRLKKQSLKEKYSFLIPVSSADVRSAIDKLKEHGSFDVLIARMRELKSKEKQKRIHKDKDSDKKP